MPTAPAKPCAQPGCPRLVMQGARCDVHRRDHDRQLSDRRGTARQRGYDSRWERFRKFALARLGPLCIECLKQGRTVVARELHHIISLRDGGARLDLDNVAPLCAACHRRHHAHESR